MSALEEAARELEIAHLAVADTAAGFVDGDATIVDLRKAVADWRKAGQALHDATANRRFVTITEADVGRAPFRAFGRSWAVSDFIGRITKADVGKRVYLAHDNPAPGVPRTQFLQVENDDQRAKRQARERGETREESDERRATGPIDR